MVRTATLAVAITLIVPACSSPRDAAASDSAASDSAAEIVAKADADTAHQGGATATTAKPAGDTSMIAVTAYGKVVSQMMDAMEVQMRVMDTASAATIQARMPRYERMADSLIARMNEEIRRMNIPTDAIWPASVDSARQDLDRFGAMSATDMKAAMPAHLKRLRFMIVMQRTMTGKTPP